MAMRSLRLRLFASAAIAVVVALALSGIVLARLFAEHVANREMAELRNHLNQIVAAIEIDGEGRVSLAVTPADPRFENPQGGLYWQVELPNGTRQRSRSLWDFELALPADELPPGAVHRHELAGPAGARLMAIEGAWTVGTTEPPVPVRLAVAVDRRDVETAIADFGKVLWRSLTVLGFALVGALLAQIHFGLAPLGQLRRALKAVHDGSADHVAGSFPAEVTPLVADMNALLDRERRGRQKARERAADLAHGFKTPLAVLSAVARDLRRDHLEKPAQEISDQIDIMGRHVRRELAQARMSGAASLVRPATPVRPLVEKVVAALGRLSADRELSWTIVANDDAVFAGDENDFLELVGNLTENAAKWARSQVRISASGTPEGLRLEIDDDGPGIPDDARAAMLVRGRRLDESTDGAGLGLSIVARIVDEYGGTIALDRSAMGGLAVLVTFSA